MALLQEELETAARGDAPPPETWAAALAALPLALGAPWEGDWGIWIRRSTGGEGRGPLVGWGGAPGPAGGVAGQGTACGMACRTVCWPTWRMPEMSRGCRRQHGRPCGPCMPLCN